MPLPKTFCPAPFMAASLEAYDVCLPCCVFQRDKSGQELKRIHEYDSWWNQELNGLREDLIAGRPNPGCEQCYQNERDGVTSYRQTMIQNWPQYAELTTPLESPAFVMAGIGTHCNLTCIFCSPHKSSAWAQQYEKNSVTFEQQGIKFENYPRGAWDKESTAEEIFRRINTQVQEIQFAGGEPLLTPIHRRVLNSVPDPSQVKLTITTSLDTLSDEWIDIMSRFDTKVYVSAESAGPLNDYIRAGSNWDRVHANIQKLKTIPSVTTFIAHVISRTSVWCLPGMVDYCVQENIESILWTRLFDPEYMHIRSAPELQRQALLDAIGTTSVHAWPVWDQLVNYINEQPYDPDLDAEFWQYIDLQDQLQGRNFRAMLKQYAKA